ncbi:PEP/pyruvate-binding domain-containing protein [Desulforamulus ruminis]|uniref:PEP/pyruvate-binding domain-containing protein n=1 Tax=Desulforamulus ruminis TaxID=1564 RepID=UPI00059B80E0|nr:PEP/pyruvate-binding domain-containing protein [Desulforamulus ruminis]
MTVELIRWFDQLNRKDVELAGGKGAQLGDLIKAGLPVPPGFVLLTPAYRMFVSANDLQEKIEHWAKRIKPENPAAIDEASEAIRGLFDRGIIPLEIIRSVSEAYARLGGGRVAVRSSATAEDLPGASFAGQQETYLNIKGLQPVLAAIRQCWSSLWTSRAMAYRFRQGIAPQEVSLAVVIQQLVAAEAAGVLFTANPVNGRRDQMVLDAAWGLGEAVVSGQVSPDQWVIENNSIISSTVACKEVMTVQKEAGTATLPVPEERREKSVLEEARVLQLVELGRRSEAHFGFPQDLEWALAEGQLYLLQSRPITSLFPLPEPELGTEMGERIYISFNLLQGILEPFTPMGISVFRNFTRGVALLFGVKVPPPQGVSAFKVAAGRVYLDITGVLVKPKTRERFFRILSLVDRQMVKVLKNLIEQDQRKLQVKEGAKIRLPWKFILNVMARIKFTLIAPHAARRRGLAKMEHWLQGLERQGGRLQGLRQRKHFVEQTLTRMIPFLFGHLGPVVIPGLVLRFMAERKVKEWTGDPSGLQPVLRSLAHNPTTEMDLELWRISREIKAQGTEVSARHPLVIQFLEKYGHRAVREIDAGVPRWREDPSHILNILQTYLTHSEEEDPERQFREGIQGAQRAVKILVEQVRQREGKFQALLMAMLLRRLRALGGLREYPKFYLVRIIALVRKVLLEAGEELVKEGRLDKPEEIFFLDLANLKPEVDLREVVQVNRSLYNREMERRAVPRVITSNGETFYAAPGSTEGALGGTASSPGVYEGRVKIILDPKGACLSPGEVLVAPGTDPAWTPLFLSAGALVMETGGIMSHGSVVAREYGIPAVVGISEATRRLKNGQRVRVDGEAGEVIPLD